jgi:hypothetical protein
VKRKAGIALLCLLAAGGVVLATAVVVMRGDHLSSGDLCTSFAEPRVVGRVESGEVREASGLAASRAHPGVLWVHNDSGDTARVFAMSTTGHHLAEVQLLGVEANDWEDMAIVAAPDGGPDRLVIADMGDNDRERGRIDLYRIDEPDIAADQRAVRIVVAGVEHVVLHYPEGMAHDAETLLIDPRTGRVVIVTKHISGRCDVFEASPDPWQAPEQTLTHACVLSTEESRDLRSPLVTGGAVSPDGDRVLIRTYGDVLLFRRGPEMTLSQALEGPFEHQPQAVERQGETIAFAADGRGYYTVSEGSHPPIHFYACDPR